MQSASPVQTRGGKLERSPGPSSVSPQQAVPPKNVAFELLFDSPQYRARLPMRVSIYPHDTTDSIITTVKNFYGLYSGPTGSMGVSFEDENRNTMIARYENFKNGMTVYVKVHEKSPSAPTSVAGSLPRALPSPEQPPYLSESFQTQIIERQAQDEPRTGLQSLRRRSLSPNSSINNGGASVTGKKSRSRSSKNRPYRDIDAYSDSASGYSSGDNAPSTASGRNKDQLRNTDISVDNIVEGGRRKRAKFESSELPLFAPPQMPAATSNPSVSPARRVEYHRPSLPSGQQGQNPFTHPRPLQSPRGFGNMPTGTYSTPASGSRHSRTNTGFASNGAPAAGVLPTPDPTVGSCMSEEDKDVAIQLMRLGDMSNISHGRTSASTLDETFSGRADAASSTGATSEGDSDSEDEQPPTSRRKLEASSLPRHVNGTTDIRFERVYTKGPGIMDALDRNRMEAPRPVQPKIFSRDMAVGDSSMPNPKPKGPRPPAKVKKTLPAGAPTHISPNGPPPHKHLVSSNGTMMQLGEDEHPDLSTKPRCQRCRKSKKGCDRQRPCGRCKDAGLSADQCVSEDEGNGRKGRYGRHMGVPIKKEEVHAPAPPPVLLPAAPIATATTTAMALDKSKKRKR